MDLAYTCPFVHLGPHAKLVLLIHGSQVNFVLSWAGSQSPAAQLGYTHLEPLLNRVIELCFFSHRACLFLDKHGKAKGEVCVGQGMAGENRSK